MVNRGGENVYCVEVENALVAPPGGVRGARCVGVPDTMMGEKVGAIVVVTARHGADAHRSSPTCAREQIADFKVPQFISFRAEPLPRNPGGKVLKPVLRKETEWGPPVK